MEKENNKSIGEKLGSLTGVIKNANFFVLTTMALVVTGFAFLSGDGKNMVLDFYENVTGQKFQTFSPIQDYSNETYIILKDKLSRDTSIELESAEITIFKDSDTSHKYRVKSKDDTYFYKVEKNQNGTWMINRD